MGQFAKNFWISFSALAIVGGLAFGASAAKKMSWFWIIFLLALFISFFLTVIPRLVGWLESIQRYPGLRIDAAGLQVEVASLKAQIAQSESLAGSEEAVNNARAAGIVEGRSQIEGAILALQSPPPKILSAEEVDNEVMLVAEAGDPVASVGAWYSVKSMTTGNIRGIVEVRDYDEDLNIVYLRAVEKTSVKFWAGLSDQVQRDVSGLLSGVQLVPYDAHSPVILSSNKAELSENQESKPEAISER